MVVWVIGDHPPLVKQNTFRTLTDAHLSNLLSRHVFTLFKFELFLLLSQQH